MFMVDISLSIACLGQTNRRRQWDPMGCQVQRAAVLALQAPWMSQGIHCAIWVCY